MPKSVADNSQYDAEGESMRRLKRAGWVAGGVVACGLVAFVVYGTVVAPRLARRDYAKALAEWKAAGLPDPGAPHPAAKVVPDELNLLKVAPFDHLAVIDLVGSGGSRSDAAYNDRVGQFTFTKGPQDHFGFDPAQHFKPATPGGLSGTISSGPGGKVIATLSAASPVLAPGQTPTRFFIETLEKEFPELLRIEALVRERPELAVPAPDWTQSLYAMPLISFRSTRSNTMVLAGYAGCKLCEGDGGPVGVLVPVLLRHQREISRDTTLVGAMISVVCTKLTAPRLTHLALEKGVLSDEQLRRFGVEFDAMDCTGAVLTVLCNEAMSTARDASGAAAGDPDCIRRWEPMRKALAAEGYGTDGLVDSLRIAAGVLDIHRRLWSVRNSVDGVDEAALVVFHDSAVSPATRADEVILRTVPAFQKVLCNAALADGMLRSARIGCALELYWRGHGVYPEKLDALVPALMPALPSPVWKGAPVVYARTVSGGYTLTWPKGDKSEGLATLTVDRKHPGPWDVFGQEIKLPESWKSFDSVTITRSKPTHRDIVWEMNPPVVKK